MSTHIPFIPTEFLGATLSMKVARSAYLAGDPDSGDTYDEATLDLATMLDKLKSPDIDPMEFVGGCALPSDEPKPSQPSSQSAYLRDCLRIWKEDRLEVVLQELDAQSDAGQEQAGPALDHNQSSSDRNDSSAWSDDEDIEVDYDDEPWEDEDDDIFVRAEHNSNLYPPPEHGDLEEEEPDDFYGRDMVRMEAFDFVEEDLEKVYVTEIAEDDMQCSICWSRFDQSITGDDGEFDHTPIKTPCCKRLFGLECLIEALTSEEVRCPYCRQDIVGIAREGIM
ncbi:hypothetical protein EK21DRAFT_111595 [Setomelanomma holmii]|uniref:RING-type domain-containing protein n=1 Tax=Setomelanomma holmii TaxID=210430 RepID=A0A9P4H9V2_9PLEO|nr:hypothetical protein EK21DRAFT_111595 [Setomelanomma holmii]